MTELYIHIIIVVCISAEVDQTSSKVQCLCRRDWEQYCVETRLQ